MKMLKKFVAVAAALLHALPKRRYRRGDGVAMRKFWAEVIDCLMDMAIAFECLVTRQWNGLPVTFVEEPREQVSAQSCTGADLSARAILDFLRENKSKSTLFGQYLMTDMRREVKTDE